MSFVTLCLHWLRFVFKWVFWLPVEIVTRLLLTLGIFVAGVGVAFLASCFAVFCFARRD